MSAVATPRALVVRFRDLHRWAVGSVVETAWRWPVGVIKHLSDALSRKVVTVIRMNNLVGGELDLRNLKHVRLNGAETAKLELVDGDILFNRTNSKELVGKCAVFHEEGQYIFASYLIRVRMDTTRAQPDFVAVALNSPIGRQQIDALSRQIIGQANVNSEELRSLRVPLPPLAVQRQIVECVTSRREEIARLKADAKARADAAKADVEAMILGAKKVGTP